MVSFIFMEVSVLENYKKITDVLCTLIKDMGEKSKTIKDVTAMTQLMQSRMIIDDYIIKYNPYSLKASWDESKVESEIQASEGYYKHWKESGIADYQEIARDELEHAEMILKNTADIPQDKVVEFKKKIQEIRKNLM